MFLTSQAEKILLKTFFQKSLNILTTYFIGNIYIES